MSTDLNTAAAVCSDLKSSHTISFYTCRIEAAIFKCTLILTVETTLFLAGMMIDTKLA
jgi:hypothetical protein